MWYEFKENIITISIYVQPGAKRTEIAGLHGDALKIRLHAPPLEGRANKALLIYLAALFKVPLRQVELIRGEKSRYKTIKIIGSHINPDHVLI